MIAAALWGHRWRRTCVCFVSDNMAVVDILRSRTSKDCILGLQRLDSTVQALISQGIAESTSAVYRTGWRQYSRFCDDKYSLPPLPLTESNVCLFAADVSESVGWGTIRSYLSGLRFYQITAGLPDPALASLPMLAYLLKGIRKKTPDCVRSKRLPITPDLLRKMHAVWSQGSGTFDKVMLWAACCLGFFGFMRAGEFTTTTSDAVLSVGDIGVDSRVDPKVLVVHLRHRKTDPFSAGVRLFLGRTGDVLCQCYATWHCVPLSQVHSLSSMMGAHFHEHIIQGRSGCKILFWTLL